MLLFIYLLIELTWVIVSSHMYSQVHDLILEYLFIIFTYFLTFQEGVVVIG